EAFQIADDLLDVEGDPATVGKATGKDAAAHKATLVGVLGPAAARRRLENLVGEAQAALSAFGGDADVLKAAARFVATRPACSLGMMSQPENDTTQLVHPRGLQPPTSLSPANPSNQLNY